MELGRALAVKGMLMAGEDLTIVGHIAGMVNAPEHTVRIGAKAQVEAKIRAKVAVIEGMVYGNVTAQEKVVILKTAAVSGDIQAPRVTIEDGAYVIGLVHTGTGKVAVQRADSAANEVIVQTSDSDTRHPAPHPESAGAQPAMMVGSQ